MKHKTKNISIASLILFGSLIAGLTILNNNNSNKINTTEYSTRKMEPGDAPIITPVSYIINRKSVSIDLTIETNEYESLVQYDTVVSNISLYNSEGEMMGNKHGDYNYGLSDRTYTIESSHSASIEENTLYQGWYIDVEYLNNVGSTGYFDYEDPRLHETLELPDFTTGTKDTAEEPYYSFGTKTYLDKVTFSYNVYENIGVDHSYYYKPVILDSHIVFSSTGDDGKVLDTQDFYGEQHAYKYEIDGLDYNTYYILQYDMNWYSENNPEMVYHVTESLKVKTEDYEDAIAPKVLIENKEITSHSIAFDWTIELPTAEEQEGHYPTEITDFSIDTPFSSDSIRPEKPADGIYTGHEEHDELIPNITYFYTFYITYDNAFYHSDYTMEYEFRITTLLAPKDPEPFAELNEVTQNSVDINFGLNNDNDYSNVEDTIIIDDSTEIELFENGESITSVPIITLGEDKVSANLKINDLKPFTSYVVNIKFETTAGPTETSCEFKTDSLGNSGGLISDITASQNKDGVTFTYSINPNSPDDGYEKLSSIKGIHVIATNENGEQEMFDFSNNELTGSFTVNGLEKEINYSFEVVFDLNDSLSSSISSADPSSWLDNTKSDDFNDQTFFFEKSHGPLIAFGVIAGIILISVLGYGGYWFYKKKS